MITAMVLWFYRLNQNHTETMLIAWKGNKECFLKRRRIEECQMTTLSNARRKAVSTSQGGKMTAWHIQRKREKQEWSVLFLGAGNWVRTHAQWDIFGGCSHVCSVKWVHGATAHVLRGTLVFTWLCVVIQPTAALFFPLWFCCSFSAVPPLLQSAVLN